MYCSNCGAQIDDKAVVCVKCGVLTGNVPVTKMATEESAGYDWLTAVLLCFFLGYLGVHSFYTKKTTVGVIQLLTLGGCGIWTLIDFIMMLTGSYRDGYDRPLVRK